MVKIPPAPTTNPMPGTKNMGQYSVPRLVMHSEKTHSTLHGNKTHSVHTCQDAGQRWCQAPILAQAGLDSKDPGHLG